MRNSDQDIVRRMLSSVLERLEGARAETDLIGGADVNQSSSGQQRRSRTSGDNPIILIVLGESNAANQGVQSFNAQPNDALKDKREDLARGDRISYERAFPFDQQDTQTLHPGLEKFPLAEEETAHSAPKTCFMEPGRACVNSGACEMRGY